MAFNIYLLSIVVIIYIVAEIYNIKFLSKKFKKLDVRECTKIFLIYVLIYLLFCLTSVKVIFSLSCKYFVWIITSYYFLIFTIALQNLCVKFIFAIAEKEKEINKMLENFDNHFFLNKYFKLVNFIVKINFRKIINIELKIITGISIFTALKFFNII